MPNYSKQFAAMAEYLGAPALPPAGESLPTLVFGRQDPRVARAAYDLIQLGNVSHMVISGGVGKDSGNLLEEGYNSEADYLGCNLIQLHLASYSSARISDLPRFDLEEQATNGRDNSILGQRKLQQAGADISRFNTVMHRFSARRLAGTAKYWGCKTFGTRPTVYRVPTNIEFEPDNPKHVKEVTAEFMRVLNWPAMGELCPQDEAPPLNLIDFAFEKGFDTPKPVSPIGAAALRLLPPRQRFGIIKFAAAHGRM